jgi:hypothetical protein
MFVQMPPSGQKSPGATPENREENRQDGSKKNPDRMPRRRDDHYPALSDLEDRQPGNQAKRSTFASSQSPD